MWNEFKQNWKLICLVFLQLHFGGEHVNEQNQDALLEKISKIKSDPNTLHGMKRAANDKEREEREVYHNDSYDFHDEIDINISERNLRRSKMKKVNYTESSRVSKVIIFSDALCQP